MTFHLMPVRCHVLVRWPYWPSDQCRYKAVGTDDENRPLCARHLAAVERRKKKEKSE